MVCPQSSQCPVIAVLLLFVGGPGGAVLIDSIISAFFFISDDSEPQSSDVNSSLRTGGCARVPLEIVDN